MHIALIVAMAENGVIGRDNGLPWHLPEDLKHFRRLTLGKPVLMGRRTFESIGRPLPGRTNIVLSRQAGFAPPGVRVVATLADGLAAAEAQALADGVDEVMVIGGAAVYAEALPLADRLYLTRVRAAVDGDARFPPVDWAQWQCRSAEPCPATGVNTPECCFELHVRRPAEPGRH